ncbi:hypothetical protein K458DRAFT_32880 [Lentithecium fluviatile CBS 122367]|uniref:Uncharacterized protein n=1 Tax=Lentithecium fluviatile CBS 122367 TaxID=1168545 RepID=A0A6G1J2P8_9PLEO|nr:hypothetical protein K458DRAFT_32880 [Lentithecium fluviatile CBS 122367]
MRARSRFLDRLFWRGDPDSSVGDQWGHIALWDAVRDRGRQPRRCTTVLSIAAVQLGTHVKRAATLSSSCAFVRGRHDFNSSSRRLWPVDKYASAVSWKRFACQAEESPSSSHPTSRKSRYIVDLASHAVAASEAFLLQGTAATTALSKQLPFVSWPYQCRRLPMACVGPASISASTLHSFAHFCHSDIDMRRPLRPLLRAFAGLALLKMNLRQTFPGPSPSLFEFRLSHLEARCCSGLNLADDRLVKKPIPHRSRSTIKTWGPAILIS